MGEALVRDLTADNWNVAIVDLNEKAGGELVEQLKPNVEFFAANVASYDDQAKVFTQVWQKWGRIDAYLASAGIGDRQSIYIFDHRGKDE